MMQRFILESRLAPIAFPGFVLVVLLLVFYASGVLTARVLPYGYDSALQLIGQVLMFSVLPPYFLLALITGMRYSIRLASEVDKAFADQIKRTWTDWMVFGLIAGVIYAAVFNIPGFQVTGAMEGDVQDAVLISGQLSTWILIGITLAARARTAVVFRGCGAVAPIDLFDMTALKPFARNGLFDVLVICGALAFSVLQALDARFRALNYLFGLIVAIPAIILLLLVPIYSIHKRIVAARNEQLLAVNQRIHEAPRDLLPESISRLEVLLQRRERLNALRTWPIDLSMVSRFALYIVIPPLAWIAAAFVEVAVESLIAN